LIEVFCLTGVDADGGVAEAGFSLRQYQNSIGWPDCGRTIVSGKLNCMFRLLEVGASDHKFRAANVSSSFYDVGQVIFMGLFTVITAPENWVAQVDANLYNNEFLLSSSKRFIKCVIIHQRISMC
jgi:hypothetical protein